MNTIEYQYKCIQVPEIIIVEKKSKSSGIEGYQRLINQEAVGGWELDKIDSFVVSQPPGCLGILTGQGAKNRNVKILVFRRAK
jgi:hypothetical protein